MNPEDFEQLEMNMGNAQIENQHLQEMQQARLIEENNRGMIKEQLNLDEEIERIDYLLRGYVRKRDDSGTMKWFKPKTNDDVLLNEAGINLVLNAIEWYLNKNTLLSNYEDEIILKKMEDFATALVDVLFMKYDKYFLYPTAEECNQRLIERLKKKQQDIIYTKQLRKEKIDEDEIWKKLVDEINPTLERLKIREQIIKDKLKNYDILTREIQDAVHSAYNRAWMGQERRTIRQHIHVSENLNPNDRRQPNSGGGFFRRR